MEQHEERQRRAEELDEYVAVAKGRHPYTDEPLDDEMAAQDAQHWLRTRGLKW
jgi:hypothetical protein